MSIESSCNPERCKKGSVHCTKCNLQLLQRDFGHNPDENKLRNDLLKLADHKCTSTPKVEEEKLLFTTHPVKVISFSDAHLSKKDDVATKSSFKKILSFSALKPHHPKNEEEQEQRNVIYIMNEESTTATSTTNLIGSRDAAIKIELDKAKIWRYLNTSCFRIIFGPSPDETAILVLENVKGFSKWCGITR